MSSSSKPTKKSLSLERNLGPSFALDNTTDFTEADTNVNEGQLSSVERREGAGVNQNCVC